MSAKHTYKSKCCLSVPSFCLSLKIKDCFPIDFGNDDIDDIDALNDQDNPVDLEDDLEDLLT